MVDGYRRISFFNHKIEVPNVPLREYVGIHLIPDTRCRPRSKRPSVSSIRASHERPAHHRYAANRTIRTARNTTVGVGNRVTASHAARQPARAYAVQRTPARSQIKAARAARALRPVKPRFSAS